MEPNRYLRMNPCNQAKYIRNTNIDLIKDSN